MRRGLLSPLGISAQHPDQFIEHAFELDPVAVCNSVRKLRATLRNPPRSAAELLDTWQQLGLAGTVVALRPHADTL